MENQTNIYGWHKEDEWTTLFERPAFQVISPPEKYLGTSESPYRAFSAGTEVMVKWDSYKGNEMWKRFSFGSSASFALENQSCPIASYEDSVAKGEPTHWLYPCMTALTSHDTPQEVLYGLQIGDTIHFEGRDFTFVRNGRNHISLKQEEA